MFFFGLGKLFQVGWSRTQYDAGFGATQDNTSIKAKSADLIASVRTVMRSVVKRGSSLVATIYCSSGHSEDV
ncbi:conserved hypothetical protein [Microsporum canis CBS 113480]|uniref:Uncharacterized protein n=1 Tax=Arthroderma otae (strain ATCC MYA-4605 / CBS 113480) TaxID=554155 RepID=C5FEI5_ARTOC|nr:conserved hypothetical protein [Microsporum canis CBS 113480]EEQ28219.1 conserved hypothetical protein [Microsporum canis CBS 113480]